MEIFQYLFFWGEGGGGGGGKRSEILNIFRKSSSFPKGWWQIFLVEVGRSQCIFTWQFVEKCFCSNFFYLASLG